MLLNSHPTVYFPSCFNLRKYNTVVEDIPVASNFYQSTTQPTFNLKIIVLWEVHHDIEVI